ncbi:MAG: SusD/RagB family nutrient-binding outer membrane lipoprotein [Paludibacter sp.]|nr:SusD/RagB family nutrient-binding outer membrane lipoprotein [Paludibacter sp.]
MKTTIRTYILLVLTIFAVTVSSCSDSYMENLNTDPSKANSIDPNAQLTTAELQTYGDLGMVEMYRNYHYAFSQHLMGSWNTTNYGGRHTIDNNEMSRMWTSFYPKAIKNLTDGVYQSQDNAALSNINAALRIYRVYMISLITDVYGDAPCSEAGLGYIDGKFNPRYDTQEEIYTWFFNELKEAGAALNQSGDVISGDVIYKGDVIKWKKLANSLRLRYAMRISEVAPEKAQQEFEDALSDAGGILASASDDALINYMDVPFSFGQESYTDYRGNALSKLLFGNDPANNPSYLCSTFFNQMKNSGDPRTYRIARFYYDGLMSSTSTNNRIDLTEEVLAKGVTMNPRDPGAFSWEPWPTGYDSDILKQIALTNPSVESSVARETEPKLANNFLKSNNPGVVITYAEINFLLAEAVLKGWNVSGTVADLYAKGVWESMDFLFNHYGCDKITEAEFTTFIANNGIGYTDEQKKAAINTQAWILHLTNPAESWANVRRSGYPRLKSPAEYDFAQFLTGGADIPVRLSYPVLESSYNKQSYEEALSRMGGENSWNTPLWWDVN